MNSLIVKLGATGDVVRTTALLHRLAGRITWVTARPNEILLNGLPNTAGELRVVLWNDVHTLDREAFDLVLNLEDDEKTYSEKRSYEDLGPHSRQRTRN